MSKFFIDRPIVAMVISTLLVIIGAVTIAQLPIAQFPAIKANGLIEGIYYVVAGLAWVLPAMPLVRWMLRPDS